MKSLKESLFDQDLATKSLTLGDFYKPSYACLVNSWSYNKTEILAEYDNICKNLKIRDLRRNFPSTDLNDVRIYGSSGYTDFKYKEVEDVFRPLEYFTTAVLTMPCIKAADKESWLEVYHLIQKRLKLLSQYIKKSQSMPNMGLWVDPHWVNNELQRFSIELNLRKGRSGEHPTMKFGFELK